MNCPTNLLVNCELVIAFSMWDAVLCIINWEVYITPLNQTFCYSDYSSILQNVDQKSNRTLSHSQIIFSGKTWNPLPCLFYCDVEPAPCSHSLYVKRPDFENVDDDCKIWSLKSRYRHICGSAVIHRPAYSLILDRGLCRCRDALYLTSYSRLRRCTFNHAINVYVSTTN